MRFEELSYRANGLPITVPFHPRLMVVGPLGGRPRDAWIERVLGVLLGSRAGDGVSLIFRDHAAQRVRLERDHHGAASIIGVSTGDDFTPGAAHLPLDGRFDWFASLGLDGQSARALVRLGASDFKSDDIDPWETEDELLEARGLLAQVEGEYETVMARVRQAEELYRRVADLDELLSRLEEERARRRHGEALQAVRRLETKTAPLRDAVASERAAAEAVLAAVDAGDEWRRAADSLEVARLACCDRPSPEPEISQAPTGLEPSQPDVLVSELEVAHAAVEEAERELDHVRMPALAVAARRRLDRARQQEQAVLNRMGLVSWLAFQMHRVELLMGHHADAARDARHEAAASATGGTHTLGEQAQDARLRHTLEEAESAHRAAEERLEALLNHAGILPRGNPGDDLAARVSAVASRVAEAALHQKTPPSSPILAAMEAELSEARATLAALARDDRDERPLVSVARLLDPEPLLEERSRLFEEAYRVERELPDVGRLEDRRAALTRRIALLEAASQAGYQLKTVEEAEMVLLGRIAQARRVGPRAEPIPLMVDDALAGFSRQDKHDLLHLLARLTEATQVVYLTDDPVTLEWAAARAREGEALVGSPSAIASVA
jgi:hypothetical protein